MAAKHPLLLVPLWLLLATPLVAQRGDAGRPAPRPSSSAPRPSPAPRPSAAPAPRPSAPSPRAQPTPTPRSQPMPQPRNNPAPRNNPTPRNNPAPDYGRSRPTPRSQPQPYNPPARTSPTVGGAPVPRVSTRSDVRPAPTPAPRYNPGGSSSGSRNDGSGVGGNVRSGGTISRPTVVPTPRDSQPAPRPVTRPGSTGRDQTGPIDSRYRGSQPTARQPLAPRGGSDLGTPVARPRNDGSVGTPVTRQRTGAPVAGNRYTPADQVRANPRSGNVGRVSTPTADTRLQPRAAAPRLVAPSAGVPQLRGPRSGLGQPASVRSGLAGAFVQPNWYGGGGYGWGNCRPFYGRVWNSWWDPCYTNWNNWGYGGAYDPWCWNSGLSVWGGSGSFGWRLSLWQPWWSWRTNYWNTCYNNSWWWTWSRPSYVNTGYWWYPQTVYCPTYLSVPSTVVVVDDREGVEGVPVAAPAGGAVRETIVAGGGVVGSARITELPADAGSESMAIALAIKYVDLGDFYFRAERFADAVEAYAKARSYAPNDASVHFVLADAAFANGDYHYAAFLIAEAVRLDPSLAGSDTDKRTFYSDVKVFEAQQLALDGYLAKKPYDAQAHLVRGYNLRFSGQATAATAAFQRVLEIAPDNRAAQVFLAALAPAGPAASDR
jgi:hypothetical protein